MEEIGYKILRSQVPPEVIDKALRVIHLNLLDKGISKREIDWWSNTSMWFGPEIWYSDEIQKIKEYIPDTYKTTKESGTQVLLNLPEEGTERFSPHVDEPINTYKSIVGVALSDWTWNNGSIEIHYKNGVEIPELKAGDILIMHPDLPHTRGRNKSGVIRYGVYFRWIKEQNDN